MNKKDLEQLRSALCRIKDAGRMAVLVRTMLSGKRSTELFVPHGYQSLDLEARGRMALGALFVSDPSHPFDDDPIKEQAYYAFSQTRDDRSMNFLMGSCQGADRRAPGNAWYAEFLRTHGRLNWNPPKPTSIGTPEWFLPLGREPTESEVAAASALRLMWDELLGSWMGASDFLVLN